ncbi:MAG: DUF262 domain-containing protein [Butyribacter sp.]|nr:DUF262 domain-containing protein [Butyribacter sp.]
MDTRLHTFMNIFDSEFEVNDEIVKLKKIVIPIIQRDYSQGRVDDEIKRIRERFLQSLYNAITDTPIKLDFIYGDVDENGVMTPLDGQQRLTTLFLLHWYAAKRCKVDRDDYCFLDNFSYETRYSARSFCKALVEYNPTFEEPLSEEIIDQSWFPLDWKNDATIQAMLVMLDAIHERFQKVDILWERLKNGAISFYFLPLRDMGLSDELYIKMNSRGKPLTSFEHFKAELEHELKQISEDLAKRIMHKIDIDWTDLLWKYRGDNNIVDDEFLRYFRFICDVLCYKKEGTTQGKKFNEFDALKEYFSKEADNAMKNIELLESFFDVWCEINNECSPSEYLERFIASEHTEGKITLDNKPDIFADCLENYADVFGNGNRSFPLNRIILLYAIVVYLQNKNNISEKAFARRLRVVHNLTRNSEDEISDSESRSAGNRMPAILRQVDSIIVNGKIDLEESNNFNLFQLNEEIAKLNWTNKHSDMQEKLFELEDHPLLYGQISIVGLENADNFEKFEKLFDCDKDIVDKALIATGEYYQIERNGWRCQIGSSNMSKAWTNLFHKSRNTRYEDTKQILNGLLSALDKVDEKELLSVIKEYVSECKQQKLYPWTYYYIIYDDFRPGKYGKMYWEDDVRKYRLRIMQTEIQASENTYDPFLYSVLPVCITREYGGRYLHIEDDYIESENDAFVVYDWDSENEIDRLPIKQNENGIDKEDRIKKLQKYLQKRYDFLK